MANGSELHELVGAYALDALEADEVERFERHLEDCPRCRAELRDHQETAALLAHAGTVAPAGVWDRIAAKLDDAPAPDEALIPLFSSRGRAPQWRSALAALAAAAAVVVGIGAVVAQREPSTISSVQALAARALDDPSSRIATLRQPDGTAVGDIVVTRDGRGYLTHAAMPALDAQHTYQLWALTGDKQPVSLGVLGRHPIVRSFSAQLPIDKLAITVEETGGAVAPTSPPFVAGDLQSR